ncbi:MAG: hypothetical protein AAB573_01535 [Patescibacteria group bacterium]
MEQKTGQPKRGDDTPVERGEKKLSKYEQALARNPGLAAILDWELDGNDAWGGYGH